MISRYLQLGDDDAKRVNGEVAELQCMRVEMKIEKSAIDQHCPEYSGRVVLGGY